MNLLQFYTLSECKSFHSLLLQGVCVGQRKIADKPVLLFQTGSSYTEVFFSSDNRAILHSRSFSDTDTLSPYLQQIDLSDLLHADRL